MQNAVSDQGLHCFLSAYSMNILRLLDKMKILPKPRVSNGLAPLIMVGKFIGFYPFFTDVP